MINPTQVDPSSLRGGAAGRHFDLVVLGATGITGRCVVRRLKELEGRVKAGAEPLRWAVAGRNESRLIDLLREFDAESAGVIVADLGDASSLRDAAEQTRVLLNLAGPYTDTAELVIEQCIAKGTSYVDVSGELPLLRRVNCRFDGAARAAGVQIVQMVGWEAMPADVTTLVAAQRACAAGDDLPQMDGPGAGGPIRAVDVAVNFTRTPKGPKGLSKSVSGGTLASVFAQLIDDDASLVGDVGGLLLDAEVAAAARHRSPLRVRPRVKGGRLFGPVVPVAFLNPPIVHRTAALLADENRATYRPALYWEGTDNGPFRGWRSTYSLLAAVKKSAGQRTLVFIARTPAKPRHIIVALLARFLPKPGTGPEGTYLTDWAWTVKAHVTTYSGAQATSILNGTGHPGYTATAAIITAVGSHLARPGDSALRTDCLTPALALGSGGIRTLTSPEVCLARAD